MLATQAQSEVDEAARMIDQVRSFASMEIVPNTSAAKSALDRAGGLLRSQQYEAAIEAAGQAQQAARRAHEEAAQQASWQQMQYQAEQRRWQGDPGPGPADSTLGHVLAAGAAVAAGVILNNVLNSAAGAAETDSTQSLDGPAPAETDTGGGSWQDDTGQGSW